MSGTDLVRRSAVRLLPDPRRVVTRAFHPGQEALIQGISRAESVIERVLALTEDEVWAALDQVLASFAGRHEDVRATFREHLSFVAHRVASDPALSRASDDRLDLLGACLTQEYSIEAAALFNPSIVLHPDQSGCADGEARFVMSLRAVGEGHASSVEFRTGIVGPDDDLRIDEPGEHLVTGSASPVPMSVAFLRASLGQHGDAVASEGILCRLPDPFTPVELEELLASSERDSAQREPRDSVQQAIRRTAASSYRLRFPSDTHVSQRVLLPMSEAESHGIEDVRLVRFVGTDGAVTYYGTYTAFDGVHVAPHLLQTDDFASFEITPVIGPAAQNKGMALFPRRIGGDVVALSRWDRENISVARSSDAVRWGAPEVVLAPRRVWDIIQLGACSSPVETPDGWLVLIHGVGPMRVYSIGAVLLDLDDPTVVLGVLDDPLLVPEADEREGYVPNVVYTCGALVHGSALVVPYGCSDSSIRFAFVDMPSLLARLRASDA